MQSSGRTFIPMVAIAVVVLLGDPFVSKVFPQTNKVVVVPLGGASLATRTHFSCVSGLSFFGNNPLKDVDEGTIRSTSGVNDYYAEVHLPDGALIIQVTVHYHCTDLIGLVVKLRRYDPVLRNYEQISSVTCPYDEVVQTNQSPITSKNVVDNHDYNYILTTTLGPANYIHSVRITYKTQDVVP